MQFCQTCRGFLSICEVPEKFLVKFSGFFKNSKLLRKKFSFKYFLWTFEKKIDDPANIFRQGSCNLSSQSLTTLLRKKNFQKTETVSCKISSVYVKFTIRPELFWQNYEKKNFEGRKKYVKTLSTKSFQNVPLEIWCAVVTSLPKDYRPVTEKNSNSEKHVPLFFKKSIFRKEIFWTHRMSFSKRAPSPSTQNSKVFDRSTQLVSKFTFFPKNILKQFSWTQ